MTESLYKEHKNDENAIALNQLGRSESESAPFGQNPRYIGDKKSTGYDCDTSKSSHGSDTELETESPSANAGISETALPTLGVQRLHGRNGADDMAMDHTSPGLAT